MSQARDAGPRRQSRTRRSFDDPLHLAAVPHPDRGRRSARSLIVAVVAGDHRPAPRPPLRHQRRHAARRTATARRPTPRSSATTARLRTWLGVLVIVVPGIIGIFWGAPLVARELETGTFRLAWTQSVTRTRWLAVKLAVVGLASMAVAGLLSLMVTWWASPLDRVNVEPVLPRPSTNATSSRSATPPSPSLLGVTAGVAHPPDPAGHGRHPGRLRRGQAGHDLLDTAAPHRPAASNIAIGAAAIAGYGSDSPGGQQSLQLSVPEHSERLDLLPAAGRQDRPAITDPVRRSAPARASGGARPAGHPEAAGRSVAAGPTARPPPPPSRASGMCREGNRQVP